MLEREFLPAVSRDKILQAACSLSLSASIAYSNSSKTVALCCLKDSEGRAVSEGAGKGVHCSVGALAESIEHFVLSRCWSLNLTVLGVNSIRRQPMLRMDGLVANLPDSGAAIDCVRLLNLQNEHSVWVPAIFQLPNGELSEKIDALPGLSFLKRYSSNSGIAFGCSENEAILHGLNEVIERHLLSKVLMSLCGQHERLLLTSVRAEVLDEVFCGQSDLRLTAESMKILAVKTIYGVYFSMAIPKRPDGRYPICPVGSGCSIDPRVAIERAVTELLQIIHLFDESEKTTDLRTHALLRSTPLLRPLVHLEVLRNSDLGHTRLEPAVKMSVRDQIDYIVDRVAATGLNVLRRTILAFENGCAVTQVYVPGLERFNLIRAGMPVVPQHLLHANKSGE